jgi:hypothetical protein
MVWPNDSPSMIKSTDKANTKMEPEEIVASVETISLV